MSTARYLVLINIYHFILMGSCFLTLILHLHDFSCSQGPGMVDIVRFSNLSLGKL